jgi:hypothetical protein
MFVAGVDIGLSTLGSFGYAYLKQWICGSINAEYLNHRDGAVGSGRGFVCLQKCCSTRGRRGVRYCLGTRSTRRVYANWKSVFCCLPC